MLDTAKREGIVSAYEDIQEHVSQLASIRDFPLFDGDFFPDHLRTMLAPAAQPARAMPPGLSREPSSALATSLKNKTKAMRKRFLVASLQPTAAATKAAAKARADGGEGDLADLGEISNELVDKRMDFLRLSQDRHWQFNELRRAHFSTMMLLELLPSIDSHV